MAKDERRQYVNFLFYRTDPAWRRLPEDAKKAGREAFLHVLEADRSQILMVVYSLVGIRADCDLLLWRISEDLPRLQEQAARLLQTGLGCYLTPAYSYLAMTKRSLYVDRYHPEHATARIQIVPGGARYLFVYPFLKTREWYRLTQPARQGMMDEHIAVGQRYPTVKLNTAYSFGLDDQEFMVAFETDRPEDFLDLVQELRGVEASRYTLRDTPIFTCLRREPREALDLLG